MCDTLLLPEDDLSLACVLTSPLGELNDDDLMALAIGPRGVAVVRPAPSAGGAAALGAGGRVHRGIAGPRRLRQPARLAGGSARPAGQPGRGCCAAWGRKRPNRWDELLGAALAHAAAHPPSLQGFVHWLRQSGAEVKRQAEEAGRSVRVMTVHGAQGLAGAAGDPAGHDIAAAGRRRVGVGRRAARCGSPRARRAALCRRGPPPRRRAAGADGGNTTVCSTWR